ncbi:MAG: diguanylate cyclase [Gammaproteobacteria bacterium]|nr:MAG: diguanylate cyclase [Gammaproteobacteria bacterium]
MNNTASATPVLLELSGGTTLSGSIASADEQGISLHHIKVKKSRHAGAKLRLNVGMMGDLHFTGLSDTQGVISSVVVKLRAASGHQLDLAFQTPDHPMVKRTIAALKSAPPAAPTADNSASKSTAATPQNFEDYACKQFEHILHSYLEKLGKHLFDLSAASLSIDRNFHYEAVESLEQDKLELIERYVELIHRYFSDLTPHTEEKTGQFAAANTRLDLVDIDQFEDELAVERMINIGEELYGIALESLTIRHAKIAHVKPEELRLPVHVTQLAHAFYDSIRTLNIEQSVMTDVFDHFTMRFIRKLDTYYDSLNQWLENRGIEPGIEHRIREEGSILNRPQKIQKNPNTGVPSASSSPNTNEQASTPPQQQAPQSERASAANSNTPTEAPPPQHHIDPDALYQSVISALNFSREAAKRQGQAAQIPGDRRTPPQRPAGGAPASVDSVVGALDDLQHDAKAREALRETHSLRSYLQDHPMHGLGSVSPENMNQIDLVDSLFGSIASNVDVTGGLKPALGDLQIPLAKLALREPGFFLDRNHAARGVIDKLAQVSSSANYPNKALESRVQGIVDDIVSNYVNDSAVFVRALDTINKLVDQQEQAQVRNRERVVKTQDGQERLRQAKNAVNSVIHSRIRPPVAPKVLTDLIDNGWRDLLVLTHIKDDGGGPVWKEHIKTLDVLSLWLTELMHGEVDENLVVQRSLEAESFIDLIGQQITTALPTNVAHESILEKLRNILAGREEVEAIAIREGDYEIPVRAADTRRKIDSLPRLRRWVRRVESLPIGTWLKYRDKEGRQRKMQLAWVNKDKNRFIFVNERGQKNADLSAVQLARQLSRGVKKPPPMDRLSLVDQSMYSTLEKVQKTLSFSKNHDVLTRLVNRERFEKQIARALKHAQTKHSHHALLLLNIDQFHLVNELYDRINGDEVLSQFARLLSQLHSKKATSARIEGDCFGILLADRTLSQAHEIADKIRTDIEKSSVEINGEKVTFTISAGVAPIAEYSPPVADIMQHAEQAVQLAKQRGRNQVVVYEEDQERIESYEEERSDAIDTIEQTLETDQFVLRAQPIVKTAIQHGSPHADHEYHYEILLAMTNELGELQSPHDFIQIAERYGYMMQVDRWVVHKVFCWMNELMDAQKEVPYLSINISGNSITDDSFLEYLLDQISEFGVGTQRLCFEITETGTISSLTKAADFVSTLRDIGCKFSLDDFGTGLASHNYLRELPVDYVKIDGSFITEIDLNTADYAMTKSINDLAHFLGQKTIAECVEKVATIDKLREIGIDYLQGWGVGKPKLLSEVNSELPTLEK